MAVFCVHLVTPQPQHKQLGLAEARGCAAPYQGRQFSVKNDMAGDTAQTHHSTNHRPSTSLLQLGRAGRRVGSVLYGFRPLVENKQELELL
jgi:hypothetical protein